MIRGVGVGEPKDYLVRSLPCLMISADKDKHFKNIMFTTLFALLLWTAYNVLIVVKHGFQSSLSATYYTATGRRLLSLMLLAVIALLAVTAFDSVRPESQFSVFLSLAGLAFVAFTPLSRDDFEGKVHLGGAIVSGIGTQLLVAMNFPSLLTLWIFYPLALLHHRGSQLFWAEMIMFYNVAITLLCLNAGLILR